MYSLLPVCQLLAHHVNLLKTLHLVRHGTVLICAMSALQRGMPRRCEGSYIPSTCPCTYTTCIYMCYHCALHVPDLLLLLKPSLVCRPI